MSRPRRAAAAAASASAIASSSSNPPQTGNEVSNNPTMDPEYLALGGKQRRAIDRAFARGLRVLGGRKRGKGDMGSRKRRKVDGDANIGTNTTADVANRAMTQANTVEEDEEGGGGFMVDDEDGAGGGFVLDNDDGGGGGGFMLDDEEGGGFMLDDDEEGGGLMPNGTNDQHQGGFLAEPTTSTRGTSTPIPTPSKVQSKTYDASGQSTPTISPTAKIPLYLLPGLLTSLGLPSDEDVLSVFRASASGWDEDDDQERASRRKGKEAGAGTGEGDKDDGGVELKDFRAVCAALMSPEDGNGEDAGEGDIDMGESDEEGEGEGEGEEDEFELDSEDDSELSSLSGSEYGGDKSKSKSKNTPRGHGQGQGASKSSAKTGPQVNATDYAEPRDSSSRQKSTKRGKKLPPKDNVGKIKLSSRQRELAKDIWDMLKPPPPPKQNEVDKDKDRGRGKNGDILGRDEVKKWVRTLGEMWSDDEITDMVSLFSNQHEGRGLSFEDFGGIMIRAGLV